MKYKKLARETDGDDKRMGFIWNRICDKTHKKPDKKNYGIRTS